MKKKNKGGWNYRVVKEADPIIKGLEQTYSYSIRDVYYKNNNPVGWGAEPQHPIGEGWNDVFTDWNTMFDAFRQPTLEIQGDKLVDIGMFK